jgi:hypothetical protein
METEKKKEVPYTITVVRTNAFGYAQQEDGQVLMPVSMEEMGLLHNARSLNLEAARLNGLLKEVDFYTPPKLLGYWADIAEMLMILQCSDDHECVEREHWQGMIAIKGLLQHFAPLPEDEE